MIKKGFYLSLALFGLAIAAVPKVAQESMQMAKADSTFEVTAVSNQNIAGGYGLGLAIEFSPYLDGGYWAQVNVSNKIHLYDATGTEVTLPAVEEVGQQLCIGRGAGVDYFGYSIKFDADLSFTLSSTTTWSNTTEKTFYCYGANGTQGYYWESTAKTQVAVSAVSNQNIAGGYGLGIAIEFNPVLSGGYWVGVDLGSKIHLLDPDGTEVALPYSGDLSPVEEVGNQLCLGRGAGVNYKGYKLQFDAGLMFTLSTGNSYILSQDAKFVCNLENGTSGAYWTVDEGGEEPTFTSVEVTAVSNQNIAGGYGLGLAIELSPVLDGGYWQSVTFNDKAHLFNAQGTEVTLPTVEEVGQQLCIGRNGGVDYKGYRLQFEEGLEFTLSSGTTYKVSKTVTFECNLENGVTGQYWDVYYPEAQFEYTEGYSFGNNSGWGNFYIVFSNIADVSMYVALSTTQLADINSHFYLNSTNNVLKQVIQLGGGRYEFWFKDDAPALKAGDTITITAGTPNYQYTGTASNFAPNGDGEYVITNVLKSDIKFVFDGAAYHKYIGEPTDFTFTGKTMLSVGEEAATQISITPEGTYATPSYSTSDGDVAAVDGAGKITGVGEGTAVITAQIGEISKTLNVQVLPAKEVKGVKFVNVYNYYSVLLNSDPTDFHPNLTTVKLVYVDDTTSPDIVVSASDVVMAALDTSVEGEVELAVQVTVNGETYNTSITVNVYDYYDQRPSEIGIVDWFAYSTFIQFPNTSTNLVNFTNNDYIPLSSYANYVHYVKHDGTVINCGFYLLAANLAMFPQFTDGEGNPVTLDENNYNDYYEVGDIITIDANTPMYKWTGDIFDYGNTGAPVAGTGEAIIEGFVPESISYRYDGNVWGLYIPYTDMELGSDTITLNIGESASAGASRVPANATTGKFTYQSSNPEVATVSETGVIRGVGAGTCTITVTLSDNGENVKTGTIQVTVNDVITGLDIRGEIKVKQGTALSDVDLSGVEAYVAWASGKQGEKVSLAGAQITGLDTTQVGDQTVVITVVIDGVSVSGTAVISVYAEEAKKSSGGCGGSIIAASAIVSGFALAGLGLLLLKKRKETK